MRIIQKRVRFSFILAGLFLIYGAGFLIMTPPYLGVDEPAHFLRAYQLSEGVYLGVWEGQRLGGYLPASIVSHFEVVENRPGGGDLMNGYIPPPSGIKKWFWSDWKTQWRFGPRLTPDILATRRFQAFPTSVVYSPISYLPQILAIQFFRMFSPTEGQLLFATRAFSFLVSVALLFLALHELEPYPPLQLALFVMAATPKNTFQSITVTADTLTVTVVFLLFGLGIALMDQFDDKKFVAFLCCSIVLSSLKFAYFGISWFLFPVLWAFDAPKKKRIFYMAALLASSVLPLALWFAAAHSTMLPFAAQSHTKEQLYFFIQHPFTAGKTLLFYLLYDMPKFYKDILGRLGCFSVPLRPWLAVTYGLLIGLSLLIGRTDFKGILLTLRERLWAAAVAFSGVGLVIGIIYLTDNRPGSGQILGIQGRYFIPFIPFLLFTTVPIIRLSPHAWKMYRTAVLVVWTLGSLSTWKMMRDHFWYSGTGWEQTPPSIAPTRFHVQ